MKKIILDVENTTTKLNDKYSDYSPYNPNNKLVSIAWMVTEDDVLSGINFVFIYHSQLCADQLNNIIMLNKFKQDLASSEVIIAHNAKYDISWLEETGFDCCGKLIEDTMIREYVMARGRNDISFKLSECCRRYKVADKGEIWDKYPDMTIDQMPIGEVEEYARGDIQSCAELYLAQKERLNQPSYLILHKTIDMMNEFSRTLINIERAGVKIDVEALNKVEHSEEAAMLKADLERLVKLYMGDTVVNLDSPQQLSEVIYSRRIKSGFEEAWVKTFNIGKDERNKNLRRPKMSYVQYAEHVKAMTEHVLKTEVNQCPDCKGSGKIHKIKKDGNLWNKPTNCKNCRGKGAIWTEINKIAGFRMKPKNINYTTVSGFSTGQTFLDDLIDDATQHNKKDAKEFLEKLQRLSSISSYLSNFVGGIKAFMQGETCILHPNFNQCITSTGRLSSTKPNLQNQPREATFPIRAVFVSRWSEGKICEVDFAQLEFRVAVHLAKCEKGKKDILNGIDLHQQTAEIITKAGTPIGRQDAKSRSFRPLYGGQSGTEAERAYNKSFLSELYTGIGRWHKQLEEDAIKYKIITIPSGRQYIFADVERAWHGGATRKTQIVNYPVQGYATGDLVLISIIRLEKEMKKLGLKSKIILTVHDSVMLDVYAGEDETCVALLKQVGKYAEEEMLSRYGDEAFVPLSVEVKIGKNAMNIKKVA